MLNVPRGALRHAVPAEHILRDDRCGTGADSECCAGIVVDFTADEPRRRRARKRNGGSCRARHFHVDERHARIGDENADAERGFRIANDLESREFASCQPRCDNRRLGLSIRCGGRQSNRRTARHTADKADILPESNTFTVFARFYDDLGSRLGAVERGADGFCRLNDLSLLPPDRWVDRQADRMRWIERRQHAGAIQTESSDDEQQHEDRTAHDVRPDASRLGMKNVRERLPPRVRWTTSRDDANRSPST